jgi:hypothetical protein
LRPEAGASDAARRSAVLKVTSQTKISPKPMISRVASVTSPRTNTTIDGTRTTVMAAQMSRSRRGV